MKARYSFLFRLAIPVIVFIALFSPLKLDNRYPAPHFLDVYRARAADPTDIQLSSTNVAENSASGTDVGALSASDTDPGDTFTFTLANGQGATDNSSFQIVGNTLKTAAVFDFETKSSYSIRIRSTDSTAGWFEETFTITVTDVNDAPTNIGLSATSVAEGEPVGTVVGTLTSTDQDAGDTHTYSLVSGDGDADNGSFTVDGTSLKTAAIFDYDVKNSYSIRLQTNDGNGGIFSKQFTITVTKINSPPTDIGLSPTSVAENQSAGTIVGTLSTTDPDPDTFTYTLVAGEGDTDNGSFSINGSSLLTAAVFNFEGKNSYNIRLQTDDNNGGAFQEQFTISVTNVNEAPTDIGLSPTSVAENQPDGSTVGAFSTSDPDSGDSFTYALVGGDGDTDNGSFSIVGNTLKTATPFNYEAKSSYTIRVQTTDSGAETFAKPFTITITDVNDPPTDIGLNNNIIDEMLDPGTLVGSFSTSDVDGGPSYTYSLVSPIGCTSTGNSSFSITGNGLLSQVTFDYEVQTSYAICVQTNDGKGGSYFEAFTINIQNKPKAQIIVEPVIGLLTSEGGLEDTFTVKLQVKPISNVTVGLSSSDTTEGIVLPPTTLIFTPLNWNATQTVTVKGVDDSIADSSKSYSIITSLAVSSDPDYSGVNPADVSATNSDNDTAGVTVAPLTGLVTTEGKGTAKIQVKLNTQPTARVTLTFTSSNPTEGTVSPASLSIPIADWTLVKEVTVTGVDDIQNDGNKNYKINITTESTDANYDNRQMSVGAVNKDAPTIEWVSPVETGGIYEISDLVPILLKVVRVGNEPITKVKFYRWDAVNEVHINIGEVISPPYQMWFDPSLPGNKLNPDFNQFFAVAYNQAVVASETKHAWIFKQGNFYTLYIPLVVRDNKMSK